MQSLDEFRNFFLIIFGIFNVGGGHIGVKHMFDSYIGFPIIQVGDISSGEVATCSVCGDRYEGQMTCDDCERLCHYRPECSVTLVNRSTDQTFMRCLPCHRVDSIKHERALATVAQQKQAASMLSSTAKKMKPGKEGDTVMVPIPDVDRGRAEFPNVAGVVMEVDSDGGHTIGTSKGILKGKYTRAELIPSIATFLIPSDVPEKTISLRTVAREESIGDGQGYSRCMCKTGCVSSRCSCLKAGKLCNSKCHGSLSCKNKSVQELMDS